MSSLENWKPLTGLCMIGATISLQSLVIRFETYAHPSADKRDELFAQALYEVACDGSLEQDEVSVLLARIKFELAMGARMERMSKIADEAFRFIGVPKGPFLLPEINQAKDIDPIFKIHLNRHPEWREPAMAVSNRFISLLEEEMTVS